MALELVTFEELAPILDLEKLEVDYPDLAVIQELVKEAFEIHTKRIFKFDNHVEKLFIDSRTKFVKLPAIPVDSITSVSIDGQLTEGYTVQAYGLKLDCSVTDQEIIVDYKGGLAKTLSGLHRAALLQVIYEYQNKDSIGLETVSTEGGTVTKPELGLLKETKKLLKSFIHPFMEL